MASRQKELEEVRSIFKSILVSTQKQLTVGQLGREYEQTTGTRLHLFGHDHLTAFVKSMSGTFVVEKKSENGVLQNFVKLVDNSNMAHLDEMVMKQRSKRPISFKMRRPTTAITANKHFRSSNYADPSDDERHKRDSRSKYYARSISPPTRRDRNSRSRHSPDRRERSLSRRRSISPRRRSPRSSRRRSRSRDRQKKYNPSSPSSSSSSGECSESTNNTSMSQDTDQDSNKKFRNMKKGSLAEELSKRVKDHVTKAQQCMQKTPEKTKKSPTVDKDHKSVPKKSDSKAPILQKDDGAPAAKKVGNNTLGVLPSVQTDNVTNKKSNHVFTENLAPCNTSELIAESIFDFGFQFNQFANPTGKNHLEPGFLDNSDTMSIASSIAVLKRSGSNFLPSSIKRNLSKLLQKFPSGIPVSQLADKYKACFNQPLELDKYGYPSVLEMAVNQPSIATVTINETSPEPILKDANNVTNLKSKADPKLKTKFVPVSVKVKIEKIVRNHENGVDLDNLVAEFEQIHGETLNYRDMGFASVMDLIEYMDTMRVVMCGSNLKALVIESMKSPAVNNVRVLPKNYLPLGFALPSPSLHFVEGSAAVLVSEFYTPTLFYMQFKKNFKKMDEMMQQLQLAYQNIEESMSVTNPEVGLYVVAKYTGEWHRGRVYSVGTKCKILLFDFGTIHEAEAKEMCYLLDEPAFKIEPLAIETSIYNLKPPDNLEVYPDESCAKFFELASTQELFAKFKNLRKNEEKEDHLEVDLIQLNLSTRTIMMDIGEVLLKGGYADSIAPVSSPLAVVQPMAQAASRFSNIDTTVTPTPALMPAPPSQAPLPSPPRTQDPPESVRPEFGPESDMPLLILQDICGKLVSTYGEHSVRQAVLRLSNQPFSSADATNVSNMLWDSIAQTRPILMPSQNAAFQMVPPMAMIPQPIFNPTQHTPASFITPYGPMQIPPRGPGLIPMSAPMATTSAPPQKGRPIRARSESKPSLMELFQCSQQFEKEPTQLRNLSSQVSSSSHPWVAQTPSPQARAPQAATSTFQTQQLNNSQIPIRNLQQAPTQPASSSQSEGPQAPNIDRKTVIRLPTVLDNLLEDDDITFVGAVKKVVNVDKPIIRELKRGLLVHFLSSQKRYFVICTEIANVLQKCSWADVLQATGRTNESLDVHDCNIEENPKMAEIFSRGQILPGDSLQLVPVDTLLKMKFRDTKYPLFVHFKEMASQLPDLK